MIDDIIEPMMPIHVRIVQLIQNKEELAMADPWSRTGDHALSVIESDKEISRKHSSHCDCGTKVGQGVDPSAIVRNSEAQSPNEIWHPKHNHGLIQSVGHIYPEFGTGVLQT